MADERRPLVEAQGPVRGPWGRSSRDDDALCAEGAHERLDLTFVEPRRHHASHSQLGQGLATAICGNDITASILYSAGLVSVQAGKYTPVCLALVAVILFLFRSIYSEVGSALPLNGGTYNLLLNTTTKFAAALSASLTLLSYVATAVVCATSSMAYLHEVWGDVDVFWGAILVLGFFASLALLGITESAFGSLLIFVVHILSLLVFVIFASNFVWNGDWFFLEYNWGTAPPRGDALAIYFGFTTGLLGITGFETSANYIEEQAPGVYPKTLRNTWALVAFFNPLIGFLALGILPVDDMRLSRDHLLSDMAFISNGYWLRAVIAYDAVIVLCGSVLTSYVGMQGLVRRMSMDRVMPQFLLHQNRYRRTNHWIIIFFFFICASLNFFAEGDLSTLSGVYTLAFVTVMGLFALGNMTLKVRRGSLRRATRAAWPTVVVGFLCVMAGFVGYAILEPKILYVFGTYFLACAIVICFSLFMPRILLACKAFVVCLLPKKFAAYVCAAIDRRVRACYLQRVVFFVNQEGVEFMTKGCQYVWNNEQGRWLKIVHFYGHEKNIPPHLEANVQVLRGQFPQLRIDLVFVRGTFDTDAVHCLSEMWRIPKNFMFMGCPGPEFRSSVAELGGLRIIAP